MDFFNSFDTGFENDASPASNIYVVRRSGDRTPLDIRKIRNVVDWACEGIEVNKVSLEAGLTTRLKDGVTTREIQENLINCALEMCNIDEPQWRYIAGRLHIWSLWKDTIVVRDYLYENYDEVVAQKVKRGEYDNRLLGYTKQQLQEAGSWINPDWDLDYDYAGAVLLTSRYLLPNELPQEALLTCALLLASVEEDPEKMRWAKNFYRAIAQRKISLATPLLANLRVPGGSLASCFITAMDDNLESIYEELTNIARLSKQGGGAGVNLSRIRGAGSWVMRKKGASGGVVPWIKLINDTAIAVNQGGRRAGAVTTSIDIWHLDVRRFLEIQTENGDQRHKAYDIFPQLVIPNEFMDRVKAKQDWFLVDPYEVRTKLGIELAEKWGEEFNQAYARIEEAIAEGEIELFDKISSRDLFKQIMRTELETGLPYLWFKDTVNEANPNKHEGYVPAGNLCVAPETKILTREGYQEISSLARQWIDIWNGSEWSKVYVKKTGRDEDLLRVSLTNGETLECTPYHHFWIKDDYHRPPRKVKAEELYPGDKLIKYNLPVIEGEKAFPYAYTSGMFSGDGTVNKGYPEIALYGQKKNLVSQLVIRNNMVGNQWGTKVTDRPGITTFEPQDRLTCKLPTDIPPKFTVPSADYSIESRLSWFAGLLDSDGCAHCGDRGWTLTVKSVNKNFLLEIRLMLQTLGVDSKVIKGDEERDQWLPDGRGGQKIYHCQRTFRLNINMTGMAQLSELGIKTNRVKWNIEAPKYNTAKYVQVVHVEKTGRTDDTYCFTEPIRHMGMFNGILTGQCQESWSNVSPGKEAHTCNLASLNLANLTRKELPTFCTLAVRILDNAIELTVPPFAESGVHNCKYRVIGVGCMGLADWLAKNRAKYTDIDLIDQLFEDIAYHCTFASAVLAQQRGAYPAFEGSEWSKGKLLGSKSLEWIEQNSYDSERWQALNQSIETFGIRNSQVTAIAPNTSSSLIQGCTASVLPTFRKFFIDKWAKGTVPIAPPYIDTHFWFYSENKHLDQKIVVEAIATMQKWIDTGISMELVFNLNKDIYGEGEQITAKDIFDVLMYAWQSGCKSVYYVRTIQKDSFKSNQECESCAN